MNKDQAFKQKVISLISENFGQTTADLYTEYYADKDEKFILNHLNNLLIEFLGPQKAEEKMNLLKQ